jgi:hypothetical protein
MAFLLKKCELGFWSRKSHAGYIPRWFCLFNNSIAVRGGNAQAEAKKILIWKKSEGMTSEICQASGHGAVLRIRSLQVGACSI